MERGIEGEREKEREGGGRMSISQSMLRTDKMTPNNAPFFTWRWTETVSELLLGPTKSDVLGQRVRINVSDLVEPRIRSST